MKFILVTLLFALQVNAADRVDFHIINGTNTQAWNSPSTQVIAKVGQVIRFYNDDTVIHQLHTNGAPCSHGSPIPPGATWDCVLRRTYSEDQNGMLYEHNVGPEARFYMIATQN